MSGDPGDPASLRRRPSSATLGSTKSVPTPSQARRTESEGTAIVPIVVRKAPIDEADSKSAHMAAVVHHIQTLYDAGTPLFTRTAMQDLAEQLDSQEGLRTGSVNGLITVCGLDGLPVQMATESGVILPSAAHPDILLLNIKPEIVYMPLQKLVGTTAWHAKRFQPQRAFATMRVHHDTAVRHRDARGVLTNYGCHTIGALAAYLAKAQLSPDTQQPPKDEPAPQSVETMRVFLQEQRAAWEASETCAQVRAQLKKAWHDHLGRPGMPPVRKVVAFALSSLVGETDEEQRARHTVQHAVALTVRDTLQELQELQQGSEAEPVQCLAQDPAYDAADVAVLAEAGITVLEDPHGFLALDETSVVFAVAPAMPLRQIVADIARPAAMIWTRVGRDDVSPLTELSGGVYDPVSPRVEAMVSDEYAALDFPPNVHYGQHPEHVLYVRKTPSQRYGVLQRLYKVLWG